MSTSTMSEQEKNNINEMQKKLASQYVSIPEKGKTVLQFLTDKPIEPVTKEYNGQPLEKVRFIVKDPNSGSDAEKFFDVGKRSARLILDKLKAGYRTLKIERTGSGKDTLYIPTEVSNT